MTSTYQFIDVTVTDGAAFVTMNRPPHNILTLEMASEIADALASLRDDGALRVVVLRAVGKSFCAGVDVADHLPERVVPMMRTFERLCNTLCTMPMPTVASVHGAALGGGTELAICCDLVVATETSRFGQPEIRLGVFPPVASALLPSLVGKQQAACIVLTGEPLTAAEAHDIGLVTKLVPDDQLASGTDQIVKQLQALSPAVLRVAKSALEKGASTQRTSLVTAITDQYLDKTASLYDATEGLRAFVEKRQPVWQNR